MTSQKGIDHIRKNKRKTLTDAIEPDHSNDSEVWVNTQRNQVPGQVVSTAATPRSYIIDVPTGRVRRNIIPQPTTSSNNDKLSSHNTDSNRIITRTRSGASVRPPDRLTYY